MQFRFRRNSTAISDLHALVQPDFVSQKAYLEGAIMQGLWLSAGRLHLMTVSSYRCLGIPISCCRSTACLTWQRSNFECSKVKIFARCNAYIIAGSSAYPQWDTAGRPAIQTNPPPVNKHMCIPIRTTPKAWYRESWPRNF